MPREVDPASFNEVEVEDELSSIDTASDKAVNHTSSDRAAKDENKMSTTKEESKGVQNLDESLVEEVSDLISCFTPVAHTAYDNFSQGSNRISPFKKAKQISGRLVHLDVSASKRNKWRHCGSMLVHRMKSQQNFVLRSNKLIVSPPILREKTSSNILLAKSSEVPTAKHRSGLSQEAKATPKIPLEDVLQESNSESESIQEIDASSLAASSLNMSSSSSEEIGSPLVGIS